MPYRTRCQTGQDRVPSSVLSGVPAPWQGLARRRYGDKCGCGATRSLLVGGGGEDRAVAGPGLHVEKRLEVLGGRPVSRGEERDSFVVVFPTVVHAKLGAANDVRRSNAGMDAQGHEGVGYLLVVYDRRDRLGGKEELPGLRQPSRSVWVQCNASCQPRRARLLRGPALR